MAKKKTPRDEYSDKLTGYEMTLENISDKADGLMYYLMSMPPGDATDRPSKSDCKAYASKIQKLKALVAKLPDELP